MQANVWSIGETDQRELIEQATRGTQQRLRKLDPHIPGDLETIVHKSIDRDPSHRYQTAGALAEDLQHYLEDEPIRARRISPLARFQCWCKRNFAVASLTSAIALLLITATVGSTLAAIKFDKLADNNATLAGDLKGALDKADDNLQLATSEQERAEGNLDLALDGIDAVYLNAIGERKLLGSPVFSPNGEGWGAEAEPEQLPEFEKSLLQRGLTFDAEFARRDHHAPRAKAQTARAYYRAALLQGALEDRHDAQQDFQESIRRFQALVQNDPKNNHFHHELGKAYLGLALVQSN